MLLRRVVPTEEERVEVPPLLRTLSTLLLLYELLRVLLGRVPTTLRVVLPEVPVLRLTEVASEERRTVCPPFVTELRRVVPCAVETRFPLE